MDSVLDEADAALEELGCGDEMVTSPVRVAIEAAAYATSPVVIGQAAAASLPVNATDFERGMAQGIAMMMAIRR